MAYQIALFLNAAGQ